jgi:hypothetical protein
LIDNLIVAYHPCSETKLKLLLGFLIYANNKSFKTKESKREERNQERNIIMLKKEKTKEETNKQAYSSRNVVKFLFPSLIKKKWCP